jgi:hypothetical protein
MSPAQDRRTALLVRCTTEEAEAIRRTARAERRTISAFLLNAAQARIAAYQRMNPPPQARREAAPARNAPKLAPRPMQTRGGKN